MARVKLIDPDDHPELAELVGRIRGRRDAGIQDHFDKSQDLVVLDDDGGHGRPRYD